MCPDSVIQVRDMGWGFLTQRSGSGMWGWAGYLQIHRHRLRQDRVLSLLIQVVEPQQDSAEVHFGLSLMALGTEGRWQ